MLFENRNKFQSGQLATSESICQQTWGCIIFYDAYRVILRAHVELFDQRTLSTTNFTPNKKHLLRAQKTCVHLQVRICKPIFVPRMDPDHQLPPVIPSYYLRNKPNAQLALYRAGRKSQLAPSDLISGDFLIRVQSQTFAFGTGLVELGAAM